MKTLTPGSSSFRNTHQAFKEEKASRSAWAQRGREIVQFDTSSNGSLKTPQVYFAYIFEHPPAFHFGVEVLAGTMGDTDIPLVSAGVAEWTTTELPSGKLLYIGATLWAAVKSLNPYTLRWRFSFEGIVYRDRANIGVVPVTASPAPDSLTPGGIGGEPGAPPDEGETDPDPEPEPPPDIPTSRFHRVDAVLWSGVGVVRTQTTDAVVGVPAAPGAWGSFPTDLNAGWSDWNLDEAPLEGTATYFPPPPLPTLPSVPGGAVAVTSGNINAQVASNPAGTSFALANGTYNLTVDTKAGNKYYGNPSNPNAVIIHGQNTRLVAFDGGVDNVGIYYITWQNHLGDSNSQSSGAVAPGGDGWDIRRCTSRWNKYSGIRMSGSGGKLYWHTSYENGQYGVSGPAMDWDLDCLEIYGNGSDGLPSGVTKYSASDRGGSKIGQNITIAGATNHVNVRRLHSWGHDDNGWWFDIRIGDSTVEYSWIEDNQRDGLRFEAGYPSYDEDGPSSKPLICRWTRFENNATKSMNPTNNWWKDWYAIPAAVNAAVCQNIQVYGNVVIGPRGIGGYNWNHPQLTGSASTPGAGTVNASFLKNLYVHHNYIRSEGGGSNPNNVAAGIVNLTGNAYATSALNRWRDNVYWSAATRRFNWEPNSGGARTWAQWQAAGHS